MFSNKPLTTKEDFDDSGQIMEQFVLLVKTRYEQESILREIDLILESLFLTGEKSFEETLSKNVRAEVAELVRSLKSKEKNFQGFMKALRQVLIELKQIDITISIDPSEELTTQIYNWLKISLNESLVINYNKNPELIGGAQIAYKGKYFEYSIRKELEKVGEPENSDNSENQTIGMSDNQNL